jgi:hypothetical protein
MDEQYRSLEPLVARASVGEIKVRCEDDRKTFPAAAAKMRG